MMTKEQLDAARKCVFVGPSGDVFHLLAHIDEQQAEIDKLRRHALSLAKALDNIEVMTDDETEIRWTARNALDVYFAAYPREAQRCEPSSNS